MDEKKGYGIVIPRDWEVEDIRKFSIDDFLEKLLRLDEDAFYRMAQEVGIDLGLLTQAGYEYQGLSQFAIIELGNFLAHSPEAARYVEYLTKTNSISAERRMDFDFVLYHYNLKHNVLEKFYPKESADVHAAEIEAIANTNDHRLQKLIRMFVEEFRDEYTDARLEVMEKYGERFQSCDQFESFASSRPVADWFCNAEDEYLIRDVEKAKALRDLINLYRLLKDGGDFIIQSANIKSRKMLISSKASDILGDMILMGTPFIRPFDFRLGEVEWQFESSGEFIPVMNADNETYRNIVRELDKVIASSESETNLKLFYYLADFAILWPKGMRTTQRYIFLYRLAKFFGYVPESDYEDLANGQVRKEIADTVKRKIKSQSSEDKDGAILRSLLRN